MLKEYKSKNDYGIKNYIFYDGDFIKQYLISNNYHGYFREKIYSKVFSNKGYFNMNMKYGHWVDKFYFFYFL